ncbi:MAG TPA: bifunctional sulfate adenylyltransferase/adenylylsulfate kinase [Jatrophihabitans sp.]|nr:bifunctional sulfate adenylyltransferase/adenylylsulfate kinase [Jatrophihabitans sp.]
MTIIDAPRPKERALVDLRVSAARAAELRALAMRVPSWRLTWRQLCDLELLACGAFSPLRSYLGARDYRSVCENGRLADGTLWPIPVTLDLPGRLLSSTVTNGMLGLRDGEGELLAMLQITEAWQPSRRAEAHAVFGSTDAAHPGVEYLLERTNRWYVTGRLEVLKLPEHRDFRDLRKTPAQQRAEFTRLGWERVVAFQTRNPMHRAHQQLTLRAAEAADAKLLIHPIVGIGRPGDVDAPTRVRCYRAIMREYPPGTATLALLPLAMRMAGPREAVWHAIIRANYGATHFIVGREHASPGVDSGGHAFYPPYAAQELLAEHAAEIGVEIVPFRKMVYVPETDAYRAEDEVRPGTASLSISGTELRNRLATGKDLPSWFTPPSVAAELHRTFPPPTERGFTVFFTGLSGAGKSTIAESLCAALYERYGRQVTLLDGDLVRNQLSSDLGFSRRDRDRNVLRIGYVAAEITRHRGIAICAPIAPYHRTRREVRRTVEGGGGFLLVYVSTPLEVCEERDRKGLYAKARAGLLDNFTGVSDTYEPPSDAEVVIDTTAMPVCQAVDAILARLQALRYLPALSVQVG